VIAERNFRFHCFALDLETSRSQTLFSMSGLPWLKWYPSDWLRDTRALTLAAKGAWIDILSALHNARPYGTKTATIEQWARIVGASEGECAGILRELDKSGVADVVTLGNSDVTVKSRRMIREETQRAGLRERVARHRLKERSETGVTDEKRDSNGQCNAHVTYRSQKPEARNQNNTLGGTAKPPPPTEAEIVQSLRADPAYKGIDVPREAAKCRVWCDANRKSLSKRRLVNWLNRADAPLLRATAPPGPDPYREPPGWQGVAIEMFPSSDFAERVRDGLTWSDVGLDIRNKIAVKAASQ